MSEKKHTGEFYGISREDEEKKLERIKKIALEKVEAIKGRANALQEDLKSLREVYDVEDKEGQAQWFNTDARFKEVRNDLRRAERAVNKPFFGRIDIIDGETSKKETFYIGKSVVAENPSEPEVIDWRAPVSGVYYDASLGECTYKVPKEGIFKVDLKRKRTYEIEDEKIKDYYDSDVVANDDLLTKYLSKSKRNVLSEIIATIQQEQNEVIRKNPKHNIVIQGSAGSGKTTVAMHRISYILYNYDVEFKPESFYIVGSNKVLLNYITGVLPDLDVYGVSQMTMEDLFVRLLYEDWDKKTMKVRPFDKKDMNIKVKGTTDWYNDLHDFCREKEWELIPRADIRLENHRLIMKKAEIEKAINDYPEWPMYQKFGRLNDILTKNLENELLGKYYSYNAEEQKKIMFHFKDHFNKFIWKKSVFELYEEFLDRQRAKYPGVVYVKNEPDLYDLSGLAYIYKKIKETEVIQEASHVVIDEAQDFGMMAYHSLKYCMSKCTFTIMGDVSQNINFGCGLSDWEELKEVMLPDVYDYFGLLRKSYRNTVEISKFATDILRHGTFPIYPVEPIVRHGDDVRCECRRNSIEPVADRIDNFRNKGYETIAIICKDSLEAEEAYSELSKMTDVTLFSGADVEFSKGAYVLPIEYSKGLEFDAVIIYDAGEKAYPKDDNYAKLLYVAATRALHELSVFYTGKLTGLIADPVPKERQNITFTEDTYHKKPKVFEEEFKSKEELAKEQAALGDLMMKEREQYGPKRIVVNSRPTEERKPKADARVTRTDSIRRVSMPTSYKPELAYKMPPEPKKPIDDSEYGEMASGSSLQPIGHGKIDNAVRWVNFDKRKLEITGAYGTLRIIPIGPETVRIMFFKGEPSKVKALPEEIGNPNPGKFVMNQNRDVVELSMEKLKVTVSKRTGAITFFSKSGSPFLSEKEECARQYHGNEDTWWEYFDWSKKEALTVRGKDNTDWHEFASSARYISHGKSDRPALIMSNKGYQILVPGGIKTMACTIPAYGPYLKFENAEYIDYIFRAAR